MANNYMVLGQTRRAGCIILGNKFNYTYPYTTAAVFTSAITPPDAPCICRLDITTEGAVKVSLQRTSSLATGTVTEEFATTTASSMYTKDFVVNFGETINFILSATGVIRSMTVAEI